MIKNDLKNSIFSVRQSAAAVFLVSAALALILLTYLHQRNHIEQQESDYCALLQTIAEKGVQAHVRADMYHPDHLEDWFIGLQAAMGLKEIRLIDGSGKDMVRVPPFTEDNESRHYREIRHVIPRIEPLSRPGRARGVPRGRGPGAGVGWKKLPSGPYTFAMTVDQSAWDSLYTHLRQQTAAAAVLILLCIVLGFILFSYRNRQQRLREALTLAQLDAERQTKLAALGSGLAHETKNPLGLIRGMAQAIINQGGGSPEIHNRALGIIDETDRVSGQIEKFLAMAKPIVPAREVVELDSLFDNIKSLVQDEAKAAGISLEVRFSALSVIADKERLRKAILNLLLNAFKACGSGGRVCLYAEAAHGAYASIGVADTGVGMTSEALSRAVEPYFHEFEEGTGLGLAITSEIAREYGGALQLESTLGKGTTARLVKIPLGSADHA